MHARTIVGAGAATLAAATTLYATVVRPKVRSWGCTPDEVDMPLPGDDVVPEPQYLVTHAVEVQAPPAAIWPWLVQMGHGRGGLYSYDRLENLLGCDLHSADRIVDEWQHLEVGDEIRLFPKRDDLDLRYLVHAIEPERALVLVTPGSPEDNLSHGLPFGTWAFVLQPGAAGTRLLARSRAVHAHTPLSEIANHLALEPVHAVMERKMLLGIKERAERS